MHHMLCLLLFLPCPATNGHRRRARARNAEERWPEVFAGEGEMGLLVLTAVGRMSKVVFCCYMKIPKNITPLSCIIRLNSLPPRSLHFWPHNPQFLSLYAPSWPPQKLQKSSTTPPNLQRFAPKLSNNTVFAELQIPDKSTGKHQRHKNCG